MSTEQASARYLHDLGILLKELAVAAREERDAARGEGDRAYAAGRLMAMHEVISLMRQQADAFELTDSDIGLMGIDPERDLL